MGAILVACSLSVAAAVEPEPLLPVRVVKPPVIDGILNDEAWAGAPFVTGFKTWLPDFGKDMTERTKAYYAYDRENLYFAFRCFDSDPGQIKTSISSRDNIRSDDWIAIHLDSFNDQQSAYTFYINPMGIQADSRFAVGIEDIGFDAAWYSAGTLDEEGFKVEVRIPFKSIRYANTNRLEMGILFQRHITRYSEKGTYPALSPTKGPDADAFQTQMHPIVFEEVEQYTLFELLPAITHRQRDMLREENLFHTEKQTDLSLTVKYGITSDLVLDGTVNPDFSHVESDAGQIDINLRSPLLFPEKRPFFLEGKEYFNFAGPNRWGGDPLVAVVHTRNIVNPSAGVKISGKLSEKDTIASILARDESPIGGESVGNYADFAIFRYKRSLEEDSYIGSFYTERERQSGYNRLAGADAFFRINRSSTLGMHAFSSQTVLDELSPREDGHAVGVEYNYSTRNLSITSVILDISEKFRPETGHLLREGISKTSLWIAPKFYPESKLLQRIELNGFTSMTRDKFSGIWESYNHLRLKFVLPRSSNVSARYRYSTEVFLGEEFDTRGFDVFGRSQITRNLFFQVKLGQRNAVFYSAEPYQGDSQDVSAVFRYQASDKLEARLAYTYSNFTRELDQKRIYDYAITRSRFTYQANKYLFFRGILEYNSFRKDLLTDFLASFLYIPGTVIHFGYGSLYKSIDWQEGRYVPTDRFLLSHRGLFFKASYFWRL